jgi:N-acetylglucosamine-6-sulfatase
LGASGHPLSRTPNIDRLAREGISFVNAFVTTSLCSPSRATFFTGLYAHEHGVRDNGTPLSAEIPNVAQLLGPLGYETGYVGKWHMGESDLPQPGFDTWVSFRGQGRYEDPELRVGRRKISTSGHMTDILTHFAVDFITRPRSRPFFLAVSHLAAHSPYLAQPRFRGIYDGIPLSLPSTWGEDLSTKPGFLLNRRLGNGPEMLDRTRSWLETLAGVDPGVGAILQALESTGQLDNTMVVFASDNGLLLGEHNLGDKRVAYEESIRIPLIIRYPTWFQAGTTSDEFALNLDFIPTVMEVAGSDLHTTYDGFSLRALASGEARRAAFVYEYFRDPARPETPSMTALRTREFKFITYPDVLETDELYDLTNDPNETANLVYDPRYSSVLQGLRDEMAQLTPRR